MTVTPFLILISILSFVLGYWVGTTESEVEVKGYIVVNQPENLPKPPSPPLLIVKEDFSGKVNRVE